MKKEPVVSTSIRIRRDLWDALDADSQRCHRSRNEQIEAILDVFYTDADIALPDKVEEARRRKSPDLVVKPRVAQPDVDQDSLKLPDYLMSLGSGTAPTKEEEELVRPDIEMAFKIADEHEAKKKKYRPK